MAACYRYLGQEHRFRAIAYEQAAQMLDALPVDISGYADSIAHLDSLKGIGESIARKIMEYLDTGKIKTFDALQKQVPYGLLELMDVRGMGPATIRTLHDELGITSKDALMLAIENGKLATVRGFGPQKIALIRRALKLAHPDAKRHLLSDALQVSNQLKDAIDRLPGAMQVSVAGSVRRRKDTIGDIDLVILARPAARAALVKKIQRLPGVRKVLAAGQTRVSLLMESASMQVDIRLVSSHEYGAAMLYFTGSKSHNIHLRIMAQERGWKINEYGLFDAGNGKRLAGATEESIYQKLSLAYVPPELREDQGEIELARSGKLPHLVEQHDIRGDLHIHSSWSDGHDSMDAIVSHYRTHFPQYQYIVITDHSAGARLAHGLDEKRFREQFQAIDAINKKLGADYLKKGVEVELTADGSPELPDNILVQFDWVTASIHQGLTRDNTDRLIQACRHPLVHGIGHPTGRLIGHRDPYPADWEKVFHEAAKTHTALEINAQPQRMDLNDQMVRRAIQFKVKFMVGTDAHYLGQADLMSLGVAIARRGWCTAKQVLNTGSWDRVKKYSKARSRRT